LHRKGLRRHDLPDLPDAEHLIPHSPGTVS